MLGRADVGAKVEGTWDGTQEEDGKGEGELGSGPDKSLRKTAGVART